MQFQVKALGKNEAVLFLTVDAPDSDSALHQARERGLAVLSVKPAALAGGFTTANRFRPRFQLLLFSQELLALLKAGLTLVEAFESLAEKEHGSEQRRILQQIVARLYEGHPLSYALQQFPGHFPALYVASVRASEKTGDIAEALARFLVYQGQVDAVRKRIQSAAIYPMLLILAGTLVSLFLMLYVVPKFSRIYEDLGGDLPLLSQWLMAWGLFLEDHTALVVGVGVSAIALLVYLLTRAPVRRWLLHQLWRIPTVGEIARIYHLARFYRTLGMLLRGGIPLVTALDMVAGLLSPALRGQLRLAADNIREGQPVSASMDRHGLATPIALRMLRVGERSGEMGAMMEHIAAFHDEEISRWVDWFVRLFEPLLMAFIGCVIGLIVVLMYFPIFELAGNIQ